MKAAGRVCVRWRSVTTAPYAGLQSVFLGRNPKKDDPPTPSLRVCGLRQDPQMDDLSTPFVKDRPFGKIFELTALRHCPSRYAAFGRILKRTTSRHSRSVVHSMQPWEAL